MAKRNAPRASERKYRGRTSSESRPAKSSPERSFIELARARFAQAEHADKDQRTREKEDIQVYNGDQWDNQIKQSRSGQNPQNGLPPVPAKPCLTVNKVRAPVNQVLNQERQADMGIELVPADDFGGLTGPIDHTEIELREGLIRRIQRRSDAQDARTWAFSRAVQAGRGFYGITIDWTGKGFDQEIKVIRFYNQFSVTLDPAHEQPDGSDADWAFVGVDMPWDQYKAQFTTDARNRPNRLLDVDSDEDWRQLGDEAPKWFNEETDSEGVLTRSVRVVDYYYKVRTAQTIYQLEDGSTVDTLPEGVKAVNERQVVKTAIKLAKLDGIQVLEETDWPGQYIPIIKVLGIELQPVDRQRFSEGMVRPAIDSQRGFNYMVSEWVFRMALAPLPPLMVAEGQQEGYEEWYKQANVRPLPYLPYRQVDLNNRPAPPPFRVPTEVPVHEYAQSTQLFDQTIKSTTDVPDPALGELPSGVRSGKLAKLIIDKSQQGNSNYLDNLRRSMEYEAKIVNDLLHPIYGTRPGRLLSIMTGQNQVQPVLYDTPMIAQGEGKEMRAMPAQQGDQNAKQYTLSPDAEWNVAIKISKSYDTRREQEASETAELVSASPEMFMPVMGDLFFASQDGPGAKEMAKRWKVMLAPPVQQMLNEGQGPTVEQLQQEMAKAQEMVQMMGQELKAKTQVIETDQIKAMRDLETKKLQESAENEREMARLQVEQAIKFRELEVKLEIEMAKLGSAQSMKRGELEQQELHQHSELTVRREENEAAQAQAEMDRQAAQTEAQEGRAFQAEQGERERQSAAELAQAKQTEAV